MDERVRMKCRENGHRWVEAMSGWRPPVQFCKRWFCHAARPDPLLPPEVRDALEVQIRRGEIPQVEPPRVLP